LSKILIYNYYKHRFQCYHIFYYYELLYCKTRCVAYLLYYISITIYTTIISYFTILTILHYLLYLLTILHYYAYHTTYYTYYTTYYTIPYYIILTYYTTLYYYIILSYISILNYCHILTSKIFSITSAERTKAYIVLESILFKSLKATVLCSIYIV